MNWGTEQRQLRKGSHLTGHAQTREFHPHNLLRQSAVPVNPTKSQWKFFHTALVQICIPRSDSCRARTTAKTVPRLHKITKRTHFGLLHFPCKQTGFFINPALAPGKTNPFYRAETCPAELSRRPPTLFLDPRPPTLDPWPSTLASQVNIVQLRNLYL